MKTTKTILIVTLIFSLLSCSEDDSESNNNIQNILSIDGQEFSIESATISDFGPEPNKPGAHNFDITFYSQEISFVNGEFVIEGDKYSYIYFEVITDSSDDIDLGVYDLDNTSPSSDMSFKGDTGLNQESDFSNPNNEDRAGLI